MIYTPNMKNKHEYVEGKKTRENFDRTMKNLFSVPKAKVDAQKPARKRASDKHSDKDAAKPQNACPALSSRGGASLYPCQLVGYR
jgi:hypothetical protein